MKPKNQNGLAADLKYHAICQNDSFVGPWRSTEEEASQDGLDHIKHKGNETHVVQVFGRQTQERARTFRVKVLK